MQILQYLEARASKFQTALKILMLYLTIAGLVTFSLFILEESFQTIMFGTWAAQDARDYRAVVRGCDMMDRMRKLLNVINYTVGYVQPLAFISYRSYGQSEKYYIDTLRNKAFAFEPELFVGREVNFEFTPREVVTLDRGVELISSNIHVLVDKVPEGKSFRVVGLLGKRGDDLIIDLRGGQ